MQITIRHNDGSTENLDILDFVSGNVRSRVAPLYAKMTKADLNDNVALLSKMFAHPEARPLLDGLTSEQLQDGDLITKIGTQLFKNSNIISDIIFEIGDDEDSVMNAYEIARNIVNRKTASAEAIRIIDSEDFLDQDSAEVYSAVMYFRRLLSKRKSSY